MATLKATKLKEALSKAKKVGLVEEPVTIAGCEIVLTNLQPEQFEALIKETSELEDVEYVHAYQVGHVCRSIIEIDGVNLRDADFVEVEVEEPDESGKLVKKTVNVERHEWIKNEVIMSWGREAITVAWRKFCDVLQKAENAAKEGVTFDISEENPEEKYRRLLDEIKETEGSLPPELTASILDEKGYMTKATQQELETATARVDKLAQEQEEQPPPEAAQPRPEAAQPPPAPTPDPAPEPPPPVSQEPSDDVRQMMAQRRPLNQTAVRAPVPVQPRVVSAQEPQSVQAPPHLKAAAGATLASPPNKSEKAAVEQAALEALDPALAKIDVPAGPTTPQEVAELRKQRTLDGSAIARITEQPPAVGLNPKYHKPPHLR